MFPNVYKDMRHPHKYEKSLWSTYLFTVRKIVFTGVHPELTHASTVFS